MKPNAMWIASPVDLGAGTYRFKKSFTLAEGKTVKKASLTVSAMGI